MTNLSPKLKFFLIGGRTLSLQTQCLLFFFNFFFCSVTTIISTIVVVIIIIIISIIIITTAWFFVVVSERERSNGKQTIKRIAYYTFNKIDIPSSDENSPKCKCYGMVTDKA